MILLVHVLPWMEEYSSMVLLTILFSGSVFLLNSGHHLFLALPLSVCKLNLRQSPPAILVCSLAKKKIDLESSLTSKRDPGINALVLISAK